MSSIHVGELTSEVVMDEGEAQQQGAAEGAHDPLERLRMTQERLERDAARTRAEGFDD
jgi:hypothetical protein